jgi:hypothetical protein
VDWISGEGAVVNDANAFMLKEGLDRQERAVALYDLRRGKTYLDPGRRWSLTPVEAR